MSKKIKKYIEDLASKDWRTRQVAVEKLNNLKSPEALPDLINLIHDEEPSIRWRIANALGRIKDPKAVPYLIELLKDTEGEVRMNAVQALGEIGDVRAIYPLLDMFKDDYKIENSITISYGDYRFASIKGSAIYALQKIGDQAALPALEKALKNETDAVMKSFMENAIKSLKEGIEEPPSEDERTKLPLNTKAKETKKIKKPEKSQKDKKEVEEKVKKPEKHVPEPEKAVSETDKQELEAKKTEHETKEPEAKKTEHEAKEPETQKQEIEAKEPEAKKQEIEAKQEPEAKKQETEAKKSEEGRKVSEEKPPASEWKAPIQGDVTPPPESKVSQQPKQDKESNMDFFLEHVFKELDKIDINSKDVLGESVKILEQIANFEDTSMFMRLDAIFNLENTGKSTLNYLIDGLENENWRVRESSADVLMNIGDITVLPSLEEAMSNEGDGYVKDAIQRAIQNIEVRREIIDWIEKFRDKSKLPEAIRKFERIGKPAINYLIDVLKHEDEHIRNGAIISLSSIKDRRAWYALVKAQEEETSPILKQNIQKAINKLEKEFLFKTAT